jgi:hypothetical protein
MITNFYQSLASAIKIVKQKKLSDSAVDRKSGDLSSLKAK